MEKPSAFVLGLLVLILSVIPILPIILPYQRLPFFPFLLFLYIGLVMNIAAGILLLIGGIKVHKKVEGTGFGIGCGGWVIIIIYSIIGILGNQWAIAETINEMIFYVVTFENSTGIFIALTLWPDIALFTGRIVINIVGLCCIIGSSVLGTIAFIIVKKA